MKKFTIIPALTGALGAISDRFEKHMKNVEVKIRLQVIQKTVLLGTPRILRKVLSLEKLRRGHS